MSSSSSSNSKAKRSTGLQGKRPQPLSLTTQPSKKPRVAGSSVGGQAEPVIIYERTPRIIHAGKDEFMSIVQRLTGKQRQRSFSSAAATLLEAEATSGARDDGGTSMTATAEALVLALGQQQQRAPCGDDYPGHSVSPSVAASLLSPSSFIFSPTTMQAIRELISEC